MGLFKKNKPIINEESSPSQCNHKYQDFPWYITASFNVSCGSRYYHIKVIEPYVCIYCGERIDKTLYDIQRYGPEKEGQKVLDNLREQFADHILHRAEVEDMINDMQLVDKEHLKYYHMLTGTEDPSTSRAQVSSPQLKL